MSDRSKGISYMLASSLFFALMAAAVKFAGDIPTMEKVFFRNIVGVVVSAHAIIKSGEGFKGNNTNYLSYRAILGFLGVVFYFYALGNLPLADAVVLNQINPFFVIIFAVLFLGEKIKKLQIGAIVLALVGVVFVSQPQFDYTVIPAIAGLLSAIFAASAYTMIRYLSKTDTSNAIVFYFTGISTLLTIPFMFFGGFVMPTLFDFIVLLTVGIFATFAQYFMTIAYSYAPAGDLSIYSYGNTVFSIFIGISIWSEIPNYLSMIGVTLILIGAYLNYRAKK
ncbi:EamA domain-containing membrane protein RarD [Alkalibaculum bacchi]|uniref:EamA domain-containing membrane protein RarD n=1 Tax=Alkalibaculum bacchi TaxID=645887 RepID=A0A366IEU8_9FIRM|nr:DMT family transporter [Alkalibaculum bacchi]RBP68242.1 EamA domain-containing membrane protein RarD [Alkalibaculum bacchi]